MDLTRSDTPPSNVASVLNTKQRSRPGNHSNGSTRGPFDSVGPSHDIFRNSTTAEPSTPPRRPKYAPSLLWSPMSSLSPYNTPLAPPAKEVLNTTSVTLPDAPAVSRDHGMYKGIMDYILIFTISQELMRAAYRSNANEAAPRVAEIKTDRPALLLCQRFRRGNVADLQRYNP